MQKNILITGANSGLGFHASQYAAQNGYNVIMAVRNLQKGQVAFESIKSEFPDAHLHLMTLDLASLKSIHEFAAAFAQQFDKLDILCNNAGIMFPPFQKTVDGFELQMGTNFLGHFALTGLMLPFLQKGTNAKVITLSSVAKWFGSIKVDTFKGEKPYNPWEYYCNSKYADFLFFKQLQTFFTDNHLPIISLGCHPGISKTNLTSRGTGKPSKMLDLFWDMLGQSGSNGALTQIECIKNDSLKGRDYIVPDGFLQLKGNPKRGKWLSIKYDEKLAVHLWNTAEELTGVRFGDYVQNYFFSSNSSSARAMAGTI